MFAVRQMLSYKDILVYLCDDVTLCEEELTRRQMEFVQLCGSSC